MGCPYCSVLVLYLRKRSFISFWNIVVSQKYFVEEIVKSGPPLTFLAFRILLCWEHRYNWFAGVHFNFVNTVWLYMHVLMIRIRKWVFIADYQTEVFQVTSVNVHISYICWSQLVSWAVKSLYIQYQQVPIQCVCCRSYMYMLFCEYPFCHNRLHLYKTNFMYFNVCSCGNKYFDCSSFHFMYFH